MTTPQVTVLVVDDDVALQRALRVAITALGYSVIAATTGGQAITETALHSPDVVLLDLGLPDMDGVEVCERIREWSEVPVIVLSADGNEQRKVLALDSGADDYVTKPFGMNELQARLRVALRRSPASTEQIGPAELTVGGLRMDLVHHEAWMNGSVMELTGREFSCLAFLARNAGRVCTHKMVLEAAWGPGYGRDTRYLREYAYRLRRKLGDEEGTFLVTRPGVGYQLIPPAELP